MNTGQDISHEIEIKLNLGSFTNYLKLIGFLGQVEKEDYQLNAFFDTEDHKLARAGWALRVRAENSRGLVTIKSVATESGSAHIRQEIESEIPRGEAIAMIDLHSDVMKLTALPIDYLKERVGDVAVARLVAFENVRQTKLFKIGDHNYLIAVDKTEFNDGSVEYELELELPERSRIESAESELLRLFSSLGIDFKPQSESKFARALAKAGINIPH
jgi:inorganic triphosphatase YgiF